MPLKPGRAKDGATRQLEPTADNLNFPRWGTARLGTERILLLHIRGRNEPLSVNLRDRLVIGRYDTETDEAPDIDLDECGAQEFGVSRRHALLLVEDEAVKVMDLGSANSTYMNGQKLIAHQARILRDGDELRLGKLVIRVNFA
jgi:pSer/pThr/pTyr-binding forkhead associated (FHA) protein